MKKEVRRLLKHELIKGSALVFAGSLFANFFNYLFHLITGRMLGPERYAVIASLISLLYVVNFPASIINTVVTRKVAALSAKKDLSSIAGVFKFLLKNVFYLNLIIILIFFLFREKIAAFLKIGDSFLVFLLGLSFAFSLFSTVSLAALQGLLRFLSYSLLNSFSSLLRDVLAFLAVVFNFGVLGVVWGMVATALITFLASIYPLSFLLKIKEERRGFNLKSYLSTTWVAFALLGMSLLLNTDVILVKHFFSELQAGLYAALSTMGKIVFFASSSVGVVFLPLATKRKESGGSAKNELYFAQILVFLMSFAAVVVYFLLPKLIINIFYGKKYFAVAPYLGLMGVYFLFYNLSFLFVNFFISLRKEKILTIPLFFAFFEIGLIFIFHKSFYQILSVLILTTSLLFAVFLIYYLQYGKTKSQASFGNRSLL